MKKLTENHLLIPDEVLLNKIYFIRDEKIMLDKDLAQFYGVKATRLREQVKRNASKFPVHFMFQLTENEVELMVSHFAIPSKSHLGGALPYAFTEYGVLMLANVLKSERAVQVSIKVIELFVRLRKMLIDHKGLEMEIVEIKRLIEIHGGNIELIFSYFDEFLNQKSIPRTEIGFRLNRKDENI